MNWKKFFSQYSAEIFLFLTSFFIRFPFFFRDYIDKDESTFILMGQSIADGHLPYDHLWDLKPPLLFYFFALVERIFPHSFAAIRFFGVLIIFFSALLLLKIAKEVKLRNGFLIALAYVLLSSEFGSLQGVMSEHFAVFFLLAGFFLFLKKRTIFQLLAGIAFGCSVLCKLNYSYAIAALMIFDFFFQLKKKNFYRGIVSELLLAAGILLPVISIAVPFILAGKTDLFISSVFLAPMEYASATQHGPIEKLKIVWWIIVLTAVVGYAALKAVEKENLNFVWYCLAILTGTVYTFYSSGIVNGHYLVQVYPFLLMLLFGVTIRKEFPLKLGLAAILVFVLSFESVLEYYRLIATFQNPAEYRPTFEVIRELKKRKLDNDKIFFTDYHIGYWLLNKYPLTKSTTHPSNLARPYLFKYYNDSSESSLEELKYIMEDIKPQVIVSGSGSLGFFSGNGSENQYFKTILDKDFEIVYKDTVRRIFIWKRRQILPF